MKLEEFNKNYIYKSDKDKFGTRLDIWEVIKPNKDGIYFGDCESYCLTVKKLVPEIKDAELYYCKINGGGHCIMIQHGLVLDCNCKSWMPLTTYTNIYNMTDLQKYWKIAIWYKIVLRKIYKIIKGR